MGKRTTHWFYSRESVLAICVGLVAPVVWTLIESQLAYRVHLPLSLWLFGEPPQPQPIARLFWRGNQALYGLLSAALFAIPLGLLFRTDLLRDVQVCLHSF